jgi:hypothetical protein
MRPKCQHFVATETARHECGRPAKREVLVGRPGPFQLKWSLCYDHFVETAKECQVKVTKEW